MSYPNILHNFGCWIDNRYKFGTAKTVKLPKFDYLSEEHIGGGMTGKTEIRFMAHEVIKAEAVFIDFNADDVALFGLGPREETEFQFRSALTSEGESDFKSAVCFMRGYCGIEADDWKVAAISGVTVPITASYLHLTIEDRSILKLDPANGVWEANGKDITRGLRRALGL